MTVPFYSKPATMLTVSSYDLQAMQLFFQSGQTLSYEFRKRKLQKLYTVIKMHEQEITEALYLDLRKSEAEAYTAEIGFVYNEIKHALKHLESWMEPETVSTPAVLQPATSMILRDPLGLVLIVAPWNYPFQLSISPLIGAIAGGNCAILKPSEFTPHTSKLIYQLITSNFSNRFLNVVLGDGATVIPDLLQRATFNHLFFTGGTSIGTLVAKLAAEQLIPTTLELGGKSPCIVCADADIEVAAKRIVWGKFTNAGQTCVAPDYVLVQTTQKEALVTAMKKYIQLFYTHNPQESPDYGRIIHLQHFKRLVSYLQYGIIVEGGKADADDLYLEPTLIELEHTHLPLMKEEIFGPILPIISFDAEEQAMAIVQQNPNPLSLYLFTNNLQTQHRFTHKLSFGGGCINNTLVHLANPQLPFGGVSASGMGQYHGKHSFATFTRAKSILKSATWIDPEVKYPPYSNKLKWIKMLLGS